MVNYQPKCLVMRQIMHLACLIISAVAALTAHCAAQEIDMYGAFGLSRNGTQGTAYIQTIENYRPLGTRSGTLALQVWATASPYNGELFLRGFKMAEASLGTINGGFLVRDVYARATVIDPSPGRYNIVFVLAEWEFGGFKTVDWENVRYETIGPRPIADIVKPTLIVNAPRGLKVSTSARRYTVRGTATDNVKPTRIQFRVMPPKGSYSTWQNGSLVGANKSRSWSRTVNLNRRGAWKLQVRVLDAVGNISSVRTITITKR